MQNLRNKILPQEKFPRVHRIGLMGTFLLNINLHALDFLLAPSPSDSLLLKKLRVK